MQDGTAQRLMRFVSDSGGDHRSATQKETQKTTQIILHHRLLLVDVVASSSNVTKKGFLASSNWQHKRK
jgi:hypothetical protein